MARLIPDASDAELSTWRSRAEARVYRACRTLPRDWLVLHGVPTLESDSSGRPRDGEADFVILDPARGALVIEVKGGGVAFDAVQGSWTSRDSTGAVHPCRDPFQQAKDRKHDLHRRIGASSLWKAAGGGRFPIGHAVLFPDLDEVERVRRPDAGPAIVGGMRQVGVLKAWIDQVFDFWASGRSSSINKSGALAVEKILAGSFSVQPHLGTRILDEDEQRVSWTDLQWSALQGLRHWTRVAIAGGAGTGKTLLAVRRAQELATEGKKTLLLCYNSALGDFLKTENRPWTRLEGHSVDMLQTMTFHELCRWWIGVANIKVQRDFLAEARQSYPGESEPDVCMPIALAWALEASPLTYDAVVVDEGQDFGVEYWLAIEMLAEQGVLAILYDPNQAIFRNASSFPIGADQTYYLRRNCRNTDTIHKLAYGHYEGPFVDPPPTVGEPARIWSEESAKRVASRIADEVSSLKVKEHIKLHDIAILVVDAPTKRQSYTDLSREFERTHIPCHVEIHGRKDAVLLDTVGRFKGLEAAIVVLWFNGPVESEIQRNLLYVALSRPRSLLIAAGTSAVCRKILGL